MTKLRKFFASSVMVMTVVVMSGLAAPVATKAAAQAGDLIKKDGLSAVYYLGQDGKRYVFPNEATYKSWYNDFSGVVTVSADELASYPLGANVVVRPGTYLVKITTDPKVYAVEGNGVLRWVQTETDAKALYGENWAKRVIDVADSFFTNYTIGKPLASGEIPAGSLVQKSGESNIYYYDGSDYRLIEDEVAFSANRFRFEFIVNGTFAPSGSNIIGAEADIIRTSQGGTSTGLQPGQGTGVTVSLNSNTPASKSVPQNAPRIPFTKVNLTASNDGAITVDTMTIKRSGLFNAAGKDFKAFVEKDGFVVAKERSFSNDEAILIFSPALNIPAGQTITVDILANNGGVTGEMALAVTALSAAGSAVSGSLPAKGNLMSFADYTVNTLNVNLDNSTNKGKVGEDNVLVGEINLQKGTRDLILTSVDLKNTGKEDLEKVISNIRLEKDGKVVSNKGYFTGKYVNFSFPNGGLELTEDTDLEIKADVIAQYEELGLGEHSVIFEVNKDNTSAYEKASGFGVTIASLNKVNFDIEAGEITLARTKNSPLGTHSFVKSTNDILALEAEIKTEKDLDVENLVVKVGGTATSSFKNLKVKLDNTTLDTFTSIPSGTATITDFIITKGKHILTVYVSTDSTVTAGHTISFSLDNSSINGKYVENDIAFGAAQITGSAKGAIIEAAGGAELKASFADTTKGGIKLSDGKEQEIAKFKFHSANDESNITELEFVATGTSSISDERLVDISVYSGSTLLGSNVEFNDSGKFTTSTIKISGDKLKLAANETREITVKATFPSNYSEDAVASNTIQIGLKNVKTSKNPTALTHAGNSEVMTVYKIHPLVSLVNGVVGGAGAHQRFLEFKVEAVGSGELRLDQLTFSYGGNLNLTGSSTELFVDGASKAISTVGAVHALSDVVIGAGNSKIVRLEVDTSGMAKDDTFSASLEEVGIEWSEGVDFDTFKPSTFFKGDDTIKGDPIYSGLYTK